ncbi:histone-lysine N-methyltransferase 2D isoform X2 [Nematostella vectensis]|uniref:histone-lysine N-methyltransferase 2D isoform X2 n=1 Tax=Nematostella vectensis TaxID=45351 RepID=UPI0020774BD2|nr:histone-lysine N-methyltransferase 2D isoform X2 [Nematostella vectensis]
MNGKESKMTSSKGHAPAPPRPAPPVMTYNPNELAIGSEKQGSFAASHRLSLTKKDKKEPQALVLRKLDGTNTHSPSEEKTSLARAGEEILETFYGMLYKSDNETREWRLITDGFIPICFVKESGSISKPFKIIGAAGQIRLLEYPVTPDTKCSRVKAFVKWLEVNDNVYGVRFAKEDQADQFYTALLHMKDTLVKMSDLLKKPEQKRVTQKSLGSVHGKISLIVKLPNRETAVLSLPGLLTMSEVFQHICKKEVLKPSEHLLSVARKGGKEVSFEPDTPLGSLNIRTVSILHVGSKNNGDNEENRQDGVESLVEEETEGKLLEIHLPSGGKTSIEVPTNMRLGNLLTFICKREELNVRMFTLQYVDFIHQSLDMSSQVEELHSSELRLMGKNEVRRSSLNEDTLAPLAHRDNETKRHTIDLESRADPETKPRQLNNNALNSGPSPVAGTPEPAPRNNLQHSNLNSSRMYGSTPNLSIKAAKRKAPPPPRPPQPTPRPRSGADQMPTSSTPSPPPRCQTISTSAPKPHVRKRQAPARPPVPKRSSSLSDQSTLGTAAVSLESGLDAIGNEDSSRPPPVFIPPPPPDDIPPPLDECEHPVDPLSDDDIQDIPLYSGLVPHEDFSPQLFSKEASPKWPTSDQKRGEPRLGQGTDQQLTERRTSTPTSPDQPPTSPDSPSTRDEVLPMKFLIPTPDTERSAARGSELKRIPFVDDSRSSSLDNLSSECLSPDLDGRFSPDLYHEPEALPTTTYKEDISSVDLPRPPDDFAEPEVFVTQEENKTFSAPSEISSLALSKPEPLEPPGCFAEAQASHEDMGSELVPGGMVVLPPPPMEAIDFTSSADVPSPIPPPLDFATPAMAPPVEFSDESSPKPLKKKLVINSEAFPWLSEGNKFDAEIIPEVPPINNQVETSPNVRETYEESTARRADLESVSSSFTVIAKQQSGLALEQADPAERQWVRKYPEEKELPSEDLDATITEETKTIKQDPFGTLPEESKLKDAIIIYPEDKKASVEEAAFEGRQAPGEDIIVMQVSEKRLETMQSEFYPVDSPDVPPAEDDDYKTPFDDFDDVPDLSPSRDTFSSAKVEETVVAETPVLPQSTATKPEMDLDRTFLALEESTSDHSIGVPKLAFKAEDSLSSDVVLPSPDRSVPPTPPAVSPPGSGYVSPTLHSPLCSPRVGGDDASSDDKESLASSQGQSHHTVTRTMSPDIPSTPSSPSPPSEPIDLPNPPPLTVPPLRRYSDLANSVSFVSSALKSEQKAKQQGNVTRETRPPIPVGRPQSWADIKQQRKLIEEQRKQSVTKAQTTFASEKTQGETATLTPSTYKFPDSKELTKTSESKENQAPEENVTIAKDTYKFEDSQESSLVTESQKAEVHPVPRTSYTALDDNITTSQAKPSIASVTNTSKTSASTAVELASRPKRESLQESRAVSSGFQSRSGSYPASAKSEGRSGIMLSSRGFSLKLPSSGSTDSASGNNAEKQPSSSADTQPDKTTAVTTLYKDDAEKSTLAFDEKPGGSNTDAVVLRRKASVDDPDKMEKRQSVKDMMSLFGQDTDDSSKPTRRFSASGKPQQSPALRLIEDRIEGRTTKKYGVSGLVNTLSSKPKPLAKRDSKTEITTKEDGNDKPKDLCVDSKTSQLDFKETAAKSNEVSSDEHFSVVSSTQEHACAKEVEVVNRSAQDRSSWVETNSIGSGAGLHILMAPQRTDTNVVPRGQVAAMMASFKKPSSKDDQDEERDGINVEQAEWI